MNRIDRITAILIHLQSKTWVTAKEIAERFKISPRTVYRDIRALEDAGVPIGAETGKGYFIIDGYHLPPIMFTENEASALTFAGKLMERFADESLEKPFRDALFKIRSVLQYENKKHLEALDKHILIDPKRSEPQQTIPFLNDIQTALGKHLRFRIAYFSPYNEQSTKRVIEPVGLLHYGNHWHLLAYCKMRRDYRDFRVDRLTSFEVTSDKFEPKNHGSIEEHIKRYFEQQDLVEVKLLFDRKTAHIVREQKFIYGFVSQKNRDEKVEMVFLASSLKYIKRWILLYGTNVEICSPKALKTDVLNYISTLNAHYHL